MTHGEKWYIKKRSFSISDDPATLSNGVGKRDSGGTMLYYKIKLKAAFGLCNAYDTASENYAAVDLYRKYCDMHGFSDTLSDEERGSGNEDRL